MLFAIYCVDKPDSAEIRARNRPAHLDYLKSIEEKMVLVGPLQTEDRERAIGSLLVIDFDSRAEAEDFAKGDPYNKAGLFESVVIRPFKKILPAEA